LTRLAETPQNEHPFLSRHLHSTTKHLCDLMPFAPKMQTILARMVKESQPTYVGGFAQPKAVPCMGTTTAEQLWHNPCHRTATTTNGQLASLNHPLCTARVRNTRRLQPQRQVVFLGLPLSQRLPDQPYWATPPLSLLKKSPPPPSPPLAPKVRYLCFELPKRRAVSRALTTA